MALIITATLFIATWCMISVVKHANSKNINSTNPSRYDEDNWDADVAELAEKLNKYEALVIDCREEIKAIGKLLEDMTPYINENLLTKSQWSKEIIERYNHHKLILYSKIERLIDLTDDCINRYLDINLRR